MPCISIWWEVRPSGCSFPGSSCFRSGIQGLVNAEGQGGFVNVPISDLEGEYLVVRPEAVIGVRVEPQFSSVDDA